MTEAQEQTVAWFKCEDWTEHNEPVGPVWIAEGGASSNRELGWMSLSDARRTARANGWCLREDVYDYGSSFPSNEQ